MTTIKESIDSMVLGDLITVKLHTNPKDDPHVLSNMLKSYKTIYVTGNVLHIGSRSLMMTTTHVLPLGVDVDNDKGRVRIEYANMRSIVNPFPELRYHNLLHE